MKTWFEPDPVLDPGSGVTSSFSAQVIDACAFRVYGHWVKKQEGQNRAMLFENQPKTDLMRSHNALAVAS